MKKLVKLALFVLTVAGLASCQKTEIAGEIAGNECSVIVTNVETRTSYDGEHINWVDGDQMTMLYQRSGSSNVHSAVFTYNETKGEFTGNASLTNGEKYSWYALYPTSTNMSKTAASAQVPANQTQEGNAAHLAGLDFPIWGKSSNAVTAPDTPLIPAHQVATVLKFDIKNAMDNAIVVNKVEFTAPVAIVGACQADLTKDNVKWTASSTGAGKTVTLTVNGADALAKGASASFYAGAIEFAAEGEYTITVYATSEGKTFKSTKSVNAKLECLSGSINTIEHDFNGTEVTVNKVYTKTTTFESGKKYLVVYSGKALQNNNGTPAAYSVTAVDNKVTLSSDEAASLEWTATSESGFLTQGQFSLINNGKYAARTGGNDNTFGFLASVDAKSVWALDAAGRNISQKNSSGQYTFYLVISNNVWTVNTQTASNNIAVYVEEGVTPTPVPPTPTTDKTYTKVTSFTSGKHYVIASGNNALRNNNGSVANASISGKVSGNTLTLTSEEAASLEWTATASSVATGQGHFTLQNNGSYVYREGQQNDFVFRTSQSVDARYVWDLNAAGNELTQKNSSGQYTYYVVYNSGWKLTDSRSSNITVYEEGGTPSSKVARNLAFGTTSISKKVGDAPFKNETLTGNTEGGVQYSSSEPTVATVNATTGEVTIKAAGTTVITAKAEPTETLLGDAATYTVTVSAVTPSGDKIYTKVTKFTSGKKYVIAKGTNALKNTNVANASISGKVSGNTLTLTSAEAASLEWTATSSSVKPSQGNFTLSNGSSYLRRITSTNAVQMASYNSQEAGYFVWFFSGSSLYNVNSTGSYTFYLDYNNGWTADQQNSDSALLTVYEEGAGPEPTPSGTSFNLENSSLEGYLNEASSSYTDNNWSSVSVMSKYDGGQSVSNRKDIPAPVTLTLSGAGSRTVSIFSDSGKTQKVFDVSTSSSTVDIYNLIPGRTYYYTSTTGDNGSFQTTGRRRMLYVSSTRNQDYANNCRDFGGMKTTDGKTLKYGLIYRGSNMNRTSDEEKRVLTQVLGIKTDIDLRAYDASNPWNSSWGVEYKSTKYNSWGTGSDGLQNKDNIKKTITDVISSVTAGKPCYIHCMIGADRTGYICLLLQAILGVSSKDCSIDYELTSLSVVGKKYRNGQGNVYYTQGMNYIEGQTGATFKDKAVKILKDAGITDQQITDFRNAMLQ